MSYDSRHRYLIQAENYLKWAVAHNIESIHLFIEGINDSPTTLLHEVTYGMLSRPPTIHIKFISKSEYVI